MNKFKIKVEQRHIDTGKRGNACNCPLAIALTEITGQELKIAVGAVWMDGKGIVGYLPTTAFDFYRDFDLRRKVEPIEFEIELFL